jgi:hypothetical protein
MISIKKAVVVLGGVLVVAGGAVGADLAFNNSATAVQLTTSTSSTVAPSVAGSAGVQPGAKHRMAFASPLSPFLSRAIAGTIVVAGRGGGSTTYEFARGAITALSSSSITVTPTGQPSLSATIGASTKMGGKSSADLVQGETAILLETGGNAVLIRPIHARAHGAPTSTSASSAA